MSGIDFGYLTRGQTPVVGVLGDRALEAEALSLYASSTPDSFKHHAQMQTSISISLPDRRP